MNLHPFRKNLTAGTLLFSKNIFSLHCLNTKSTVCPISTATTRKIMNLHICLKTSILGDSIREKGFLHVINENRLPDCHSISGKIMNLHTCGKKFYYWREFCVVKLLHTFSTENYKPSKSLIICCHSLQ